MDEATLEPNAQYGDLEYDLERLMAAVADHIRGQV